MKKCVLLLISLLLWGCPPPNSSDGFDGGTPIHDAGNPPNPRVDGNVDGGIGAIDAGSSTSVESGPTPTPADCGALSPVHPGITAQDEEALLGLADIACVDGDLKIQHMTGLSEFSLPNLQRVVGDVVIYDNADLANVEMTGLLWLAGDLYIGGNEGLTSFDVAALEEVGGTLTLTMNPQWETIQSFDSLSQADSVQILDLEALTHLRLASLQGLNQRLVIERNESLTLLELPQLSEIKSHFIFRSQLSLEELSLPGLEAVDGDLLVTTNEGLQKLHFPRLGLIGGDLVLAGNPDLPACEGDALRDRVEGAEGIGGETRIEYGASDAGCED